MKSYSQNPKLSLEANLPITTGNNFVKESYKGIFDLGAQYRFIESDLLNIGGSINGSVLKTNNDDSTVFDIFLYTIQPRIFAEFNLAKSSKLHPQIAIGYTFFTFKGESRNIPDFPATSVSESQNGFNINLGFIYDISTKVFLKAQYDFIKISTDRDVPKTSFNTNVNLLKLGIGLRV